MNLLCCRLHSGAAFQGDGEINWPAGAVRLGVLQDLEQEKSSSLCHPKPGPEDGPGEGSPQVGNVHSSLLFESVFSSFTLLYSLAVQQNQMKVLTLHRENVSCNILIGQSVLILQEQPSDNYRPSMDEGERGEAREIPLSSHSFSNSWEREEDNKAEWLITSDSTRDESLHH